MREPATMGRPREFDEDVALDAIMGVFWAQGFEGTSMSDLVGATGLKKGSLYAAFGNKRAMYHKALALYDRTLIDTTVQGLRGGGTPRSRIEQFLGSAVSRASSKSGGRGCFVCNASIDQAPTDADTAGLVQASLSRLEAALADVVSELGAGSGGPDMAAADAQLRARHLMSVYFGLRVLAKAGAATAVLEDTQRAALASLRSE